MRILGKIRTHGRIIRPFGVHREVREAACVFDGVEEWVECAGRVKEESQAEDIHPACREVLLALFGEARTSEQVMVYGLGLVAALLASQGVDQLEAIEVLSQLNVARGLLDPVDEADAEFEPACNLEESVGDLVSLS